MVQHDAVFFDSMIRPIFFICKKVVPENRWIGLFFKISVFIWEQDLKSSAESSTKELLDRSIVSAFPFRVEKYLNKYSKRKLLCIQNLKIYPRGSFWNPFFFHFRLEKNPENLEAGIGETQFSTPRFRIIFPETRIPDRMQSLLCNLWIWSLKIIQDLVTTGPFSNLQAMLRAESSEIWLFEKSIDFIPLTTVLEPVLRSANWVEKVGRDVKPASSHRRVFLYSFRII